MSLFGVYLFCVALGGVLILTSFFFGDADADADVDADVDLDGDFDADLDADVDGDLDGGGSGLEWSVLPFGSLRFWTFLVESFGLTGALLTLVGVPSAWTMGISLMMGSMVGWFAFQFFKYLAKEEVSADVGLSRFAGEEAECVVAVRGSGKGKVRIDTLAERVEILATSADDHDIEKGTKVIVVSVVDGVADVTPLLPTGMTTDEVERQTKARAAGQRQTQ